MTPEMEEGFKREMQQNMGVFCASTDPRNQLLWSHYADAHRGICIQIATYEDELFLFNKKVIYSNTFPTLIAPTPLNQKDYYLHKSTQWSYEKEWRVVLPFNSVCISLRPPAIRAVILGDQIERDTLDTVKALLHEREHLGNPFFKVYQARLNDNDYGVSIRCESNRSVL